MHRIVPLDEHQSHMNLMSERILGANTLPNECASMMVASDHSSSYLFLKFKSPKVVQTQDLIRTHGIGHLSTTSHT